MDWPGSLSLGFFVGAIRFVTYLTKGIKRIITLQFVDGI
jgi:hypothetical protein